MTRGVGTDIVAVDRIARLIDERGDAFLGRWFTAEEIAYCSAKSRPELHFAARIAAKEAVLKALRSRWDGPMQWRNIQIQHDDVGAPVVRLHGAVREQALAAGIGSLHVSLSHSDSHASAVVVADPL